MCRLESRGNTGACFISGFVFKMEDFDIGQLVLKECGAHLLSHDLWEHDPEANKPTPATSTGSIILLNIDIVDEACKSMTTDDCMPEEVQEFCKNADRKQLLSLLQFFDKCLVPRGKFKNAAREKAFANFHRELQVNSRKVAEATSPVIAPWLCLNTFERLVLKNYDEPFQRMFPQCPEIAEEERDIVEYIGGYVVHAMKKQAQRLEHGGERDGIIECLCALTVGVDSSEKQREANCDAENLPSKLKKTFTETLDRGGLTKIKPNAGQIFLALESTFRTLFSSASFHEKPQFQLFFSKACDTESVSTCFFDEVYNVDTSVDTKEKVLRGIAKLYFKVRINHTCKTYMDEHRKKLKTSKKEKSLRKTLKQMPASEGEAC